LGASVPSCTCEPHVTTASPRTLAVDVYDVVAHARFDRGTP
ncbi:MAG: hypothetical protein ACJA2F_001487, partial [Nitriliruptoraceae bacterium]